MTFEKWELERPKMLGGRLSVLNDWKAEREDWREGIEGLKLSVVDLRNERDRLVIEREKLIGALEQIRQLDYQKYGHDFAVTLGRAKEMADFILAEIKEQE